MRKTPEYWHEAWRKAAQGATVQALYPSSKVCWDSSADLYDLGMGASTKRVTQTFKILEEMGFAPGVCTTALDIGSGTGNYTLPLSSYVKEVTALDCSEKMNTYLAEKLSQKNITNVELLTGDFQTYNFPKRTYDLVIGSLNPSLYNPNSFEKMMKLTGKVFVYIGIIPKEGKKKKNQTLEEIICGKRRTYNGSNDIMYPYEFLKAKGYFPRIKEVECSWNYWEKAEHAEARILHMLSHSTKNIPDWRQRVKDYVTEKSVDGMVPEQGRVTLGVLCCAMG